ncbi:unnamed protein product [Durusdinium trenchii]|uniref:Uncharacterized protein n=1 Tax=Durusdinium trenchii TaxID=1381693 RepID=A0ABP0KIC9_9DINO
MACILLLALNKDFDVFNEAYSFLELFSGKGWVSAPVHSQLQIRELSRGHRLGMQTALLILAITAMGGTWILEQPRSSLVIWHPRIRLLWRLLPKVYEARWWACMYGSATAKRHIAWSNSPTVQLLDLGQMVRAHYKLQGAKSTKKYRNKRGKVAFCGSSFLKQTQTYPPGFAKKITKLHSRFCAKRTLEFGAGIEGEHLNLGVYLFEGLSWDTDWWLDAGMDSTFCYLRGAKGLCLGSLRHLFPTHI